MTPRYNWRKRYADWPEALAKLEYCARTLERVNQLDPLVSTREADEDVSSISSSVEEFYQTATKGSNEEMPPGLDGSLQAIFDDYDEGAHPEMEPLSAAELILRLEREIVANVYRWTGHFPEATRHLIQSLAERASQLQQVYPKERETELTVAVTTLVTSLAMNHVGKGSYFK